MTGDKTLLKEVQMGKGGRITYGDGRGSRQISSASANFVTMIWWCNYPKGNVIYLTAVANGLWGEKELLTIAIVFLVSLQTLKFFAIRQP
jgi:hypothetical protein